jgi:hypothetical protein
MAASLTCAATKSHLHITGTHANAESRQKCRPCSITWPRVLLEASGSLEGSWRAGRQHRREYWVKSCSPALHVAAAGAKGRLRVPHSGVDPPDRRRWGAAGCSRQPQQAQNQDAPSICFSEHTPQSLALRGFQVHRGMTSEGRSLHLARPDPIQLDQHAPRRSWHPAAPRRERMERALAVAV